MPFKAFISYSHGADSLFAQALQSALHRFAKPFYRPRAIHVFRDKTELSANPALWPSIEKALRESEWLILLASAGAARSVWVQREIATWLELHQGPSAGPERTAPAGTSHAGSGGRRPGSPAERSSTASRSRWPPCPKRARRRSRGSGIGRPTPDLCPTHRLPGFGRRAGAWTPGPPRPRRRHRAGDRDRSKCFSLQRHSWQKAFGSTCVQAAVIDSRMILLSNPGRSR